MYNASSSRSVDGYEYFVFSLLAICGRGAWTLRDDLLFTCTVTTRVGNMYRELPENHIYVRAELHVPGDANSVDFMHYPHHLETCYLRGYVFLRYGPVYRTLLQHLPPPI